MVLVFGTICIDRVRLVPHLPQAGGYVEITGETDLLGGEAANTANALKTWNRPVQLYGNPVGMPPDGAHLQELLEAKGLENLSDKVVADGNQTPICDIYVTPDGDRTMFGKGFSTMEIGLSVDPIRHLRADWFTAEPNMRNATRDAVTLAHAAGMKLYLMDLLDSREVPPGSFWQCSTDWAGTRNNTQKNVEWVRNWVAQTGSFAVLSDGPNGFVAGSPNHPIRSYPPFPAPVVVDTTGAGDMFRAGMLYGLDQGWDVPDCLRFAAAAGCLKCRAIGATTEVPTVEEIEEHIRLHPQVSRQFQ